VFFVTPLFRAWVNFASTLATALKFPELFFAFALLFSKLENVEENFRENQHQHI